jgi:hypothetical protein
MSAGMDAAHLVGQISKIPGRNTPWSIYRASSDFMPCERRTVSPSSTRTSASLMPLCLSATKCALLILIPSQYATTKLDSFYTIPHLKRADGSDPQNANNNSPLFKRSWQFWSRHLNNDEWRVGIDGFETYLQYVRSELRGA